MTGHNKVALVACSMALAATENYRDMMLEAAATAAAAEMEAIPPIAVSAAATLEQAVASMRECEDDAGLDAYWVLFKRAREDVNRVLTLIQQAADTEDEARLESLIGLVVMGGLIASLGSTITSLVNDAHNAWTWPTVEVVLSANRRMKARTDFEKSLKGLVKGLEAGMAGDGGSDVKIHRIDLGPDPGSDSRGEDDHEG